MLAEQQGPRGIANDEPIAKVRATKQGASRGGAESAMARITLDVRNLSTMPDTFPAYDNRSPASTFATVLAGLAAAEADVAVFTGGAETAEVLAELARSAAREPAQYVGALPSPNSKRRSRGGRGGDAGSATRAASVSAPC